MRKWVNTITKDKTLAEAVKQMIEEKTNGMIVVDDEGHPIGILSSLKVIRETIPSYLKEASFSKFGAEGTFDRQAMKVKDKKVEDMMITKFHALSLKDPMIEAAAYAAKSKLRTIPVNDVEGPDGKLVGVITRTCIKNALYDVLFNDSKFESKGEPDSPKDREKEPDRDKEEN